MFHNFALALVPFLTKLAILLLGFCLSVGFSRIVLRPRRVQGKKEIIPATPKDTMIVSRERLFKHMQGK